MTDYETQLLSVLNLFITYQAQWPYLEARPMPSRVWYGNLPGLAAHLKAGGTVTDDCSGSATCGFNLAGWDDPNGSRFNGFGNTETAQAHLPNFTDTSRITPCTIGIYGGDPERQHEIVFLETWKGPDTEVFSHGVAYSCKSTVGAETAGHPGQPLVFLDVSGLIPAPPPDPYHYAYYDTTMVRDLPHGPATERAIVEKYDQERKHLSAANAVLVGQLEDDLKALAKRVADNKKGKTPAYIAAHHMDFRQIWLTRRGNGQVVVK